MHIRASPDVVSLLIPIGISVIIVITDIVSKSPLKSFFLIFVTIPNYFLGFPGDSAGEESACNVGDLGWIPGLGRSPGEGKGYPLQYSDLENSKDYIVHGVAKSQTRLRDFHNYFLLVATFTAFA